MEKRNGLLIAILIVLILMFLVSTGLMPMLIGVFVLLVPITLIGFVIYYFVSKIRKLKKKRTKTITLRN